MDSDAEMRILVINDNPAINMIIEEILSDDGHETKSVTKLEDAERETETFKPNVVVMDETVEGRDSMSYADTIDPDSGIKLLVLTNGKRPLPKDKPSIVGVVHKPFRAAAILDSIRTIRDGGTYVPTEVVPAPVEEEKKKRKIFGKNEVRKEEPKDDEDYIIRFGKSYIIYEDLPQSVYTVTKEMINQGGNILVVSFDRKITIQNLINYELADVMYLTPKGKLGSEDAGKLGTILARIMKYIEQAVRPVIVLNDLTKLIEANDLNRVLTLLIQTFKGIDGRKQFSMIVSVRESMFTDKDKVLLGQFMDRYNFSLESLPGGDEQ